MRARQAKTFRTFFVFSIAAGCLWASQGFAQTQSVVITPTKLKTPTVAQTPTPVQAQTIVQAPTVVTNVAPANVNSNLLAGQWFGSWKSCKNGHNGRLRATFCRIDKCHVRATFKGTFAKIVPFRYPATLKIVHEEPGLMIVSGSQRLGPISGTFTYTATITNNSFSATYRSKRDWGHWNLQRCCR